MATGQTFLLQPLTASLHLLSNVTSKDCVNKRLEDLKIGADGRSDCHKLLFGVAL